MGNKEVDATNLFKNIVKIKDVEECAKFFEDLCTTTELSAMAQRFEVASLLLDHKIYLDIMEQTSASTATISRVKRMLRQGTGCLAEVISRDEQE